MNQDIILLIIFEQCPFAVNYRFIDFIPERSSLIFIRIADLPERFAPAENPFGVIRGATVSMPIKNIPNDLDLL